MSPKQVRDISLASLLAAALAGAGIAAAIGGNWVKEGALKRERQMRTQSSEAATRLTRATDDQAQIAAYLQRYQRYLDIKAIRSPSTQDSEQGERLDWIERLVEAREARALPRIAYSIAARKPFSELPNPAQGLSFHASRMKLELGLIHEGDFFDYFRRLKSPPAGVFMVDRCVLQTRLPPGPKPATNTPSQGSPIFGGGAPKPAATGLEAANLTAECEIDWITLIDDARVLGAQTGGK